MRITITARAYSLPDTYWHAGAPLNPPIEGREVVIVGTNNGEVLNEKKSSLSHINVTKGLVMLMPKEEPYLLRNIGKENLELLVIEVKK